MKFDVVKALSVLESIAVIGGICALSVIRNYATLRPPRFGGETQDIEILSITLICYSARCVAAAHH
jgi:hypothetical protein